ncbi:MFS transporter [Galbitalea sp. SE-J8]|uniref:MFS transporter n=1 Tax=Galbitalea sp. SE-J8 TaxID=3054952 RepID=UPI00259CB257|nr:MFS transporter [Galbitalea sp. SE-J8]MDM4764068.1 MFS transporter [Galbitalea sp. SE-J8]
MTAGRGHWPAVWVLSVGFFLVSIDGSIVVVATPNLMTSLGADTDLALWVTSAYLLCSAAPLLLFGRLGDRFGRGRVYLVGLAGFVVASGLCAAAPGIGWLIAARALQGVAGAAMAPQSLAIIREVTPPARLGSAMGVWGSTAGVANVVGPALGGVLVDAAGWRSVFLVNVPLGAIVLALALVIVPRGSPRRIGMDPAGAALSFVGFVLIVFAIQQGERFGWGVVAGPVSIPALLVAGSVALLAFVLVERRAGERALLPLGVFRLPGYTPGFVGVAAVALIVTAVPIPLALAAQQALALGATGAALLQLPIGLGAAALAAPAGRLVDRFGGRPVALVGVSGYVIGSWGIAGAIGAGSIPLVVLATAGFGVANSLVWASLAALAMSGVPGRLAGAASASYNTGRQLGAVLGSAGVAAIVQAGLARQFAGDPTLLASAVAGVVPGAAVGRYLAAMAVAVLAAGLAGLVAVPLLARKPRTRMVTGGRGGAAETGAQR